jgi:hypothetical protein
VVLSAIVAALLWPIHSEVVETSAVVMSFAGISYVTDHHDAHKLAAAAAALHDTLEAAEVETRALKVPDSMHKVQDQYLERSGCWRALRPRW